MLESFLKMLREQSYIVLDTETTDLYDGEICQIAIMSSDGETLLDTLVRTARPIPAKATAIHGITNEMVSDAPTWSNIHMHVVNHLTGRNVVVYNATYDRKMMHQSGEKAGLPKTDWKQISTWWCAMDAFSEIYGEWNDYHGSYTWQRLSTAARYYRIPVADAHSALGDAKMTLAVCQKMADRVIPVK